MPTARWSLLSKTSWSARSSHCVSTTKSGLIVVYGGELKPRTPVDAASDVKDGVIKGSVHVFDIKHLHLSWRGVSGANDARSWQTLTPHPPSARDDHGRVALIPEPRVGATTVTDGDNLYLWGGRGGVDMSPLDNTEAGVWRGTVDVQDNGRSGGVAWERLPAVNEEEAPEPRSYHAAAILEVPEPT